MHTLCTTHAQPVCQAVHPDRRVNRSGGRDSRGRARGGRASAGAGFPARSGGAGSARSAPRATGSRRSGGTGSRRCCGVRTGCTRTRDRHAISRHRTARRLVGRSGGSGLQPPVLRPHRFRHEALRRSDPMYDLVAVLDWNRHPAVTGRGSAIFLHVWRRAAASDRGVRRLPAGRSRAGSWRAGRRGTGWWCAVEAGSGRSASGRGWASISPRMRLTVAVRVPPAGFGRRQIRARTPPGAAAIPRPPGRPRPDCSPTVQAARPFASALTRSGERPGRSSASACRAATCGQSPLRSEGSPDAIPACGHDIRPLV